MYTLPSCAVPTALAPGRPRPAEAVDPRRGSLLPAVRLPKARALSPMSSNSAFCDSNLSTLSNMDGEEQLCEQNEDYTHWVPGRMFRESSLDVRKNIILQRKL